MAGNGRGLFSVGGSWDVMWSFHRVSNFYSGSYVKVSKAGRRLDSLIKPWHQEGRKWWRPLD